jgi:hypothetical protein
VEGLDAVGLFQTWKNRDREAIARTVRHEMGRCSFRDYSLKFAPWPADMQPHEGFGEGWRDRRT